MEAIHNLHRIVSGNLRNHMLNIKVNNFQHIPEKEIQGTIDKSSTEKPDITSRYQSIMEGFTGKVLGGAIHDGRHTREHNEAPQVNKQVLSAARKIDREGTSKSVNFMLFHDHSLNNDDMYWLSSIFNTHTRKGLAVNMVDLSNNNITLIRDHKLTYQDLPFFSFNSPYNTPRNILRLDLSNNQIGDAGAKAIADALANGVLPITKYVNLSGNNITKEGDNKLVQVLKGKVKDIVIVTRELNQNFKIITGSKEEKIAIFKALLKQGAEMGIDTKAIVADGSIKNQISLSKKTLVGFAKCHFNFEDMIKGYVQDKITAKISKTFSKIFGKIIDIEGIVSCYLEADNAALTSYVGQAVLKNELCVMGETEFCNE